MQLVEYDDASTHMVEHLSVVAFLFADMLAFFVEKAMEAVECLIESASPKTVFVETEVGFIILQRIKHVGGFVLEMFSSKHIHKNSYDKSSSETGE